MKIFLWIAAGLLALGIGVVVAGQFGLFVGTTPNNLGIKNGRLSPPSLTPNSVSSQADLYPAHPQKEYASIAPLEFTGDGKAAMDKLAALLEQSERTIVVRREPDYIYAQNTTRVLKFTDDVEFWLDEPNHVIHVRSASRLGRNDLGVNRARVESIRTRFSN